MKTRTGRRELWVWTAATALGGVLVLAASGQAWVRILQGGGSGAEAPTGGALGPALTPVALAGLAGVVAVLATKGVGRRIVGALLALCGAGAGAAIRSALDTGTVTGWLSEQNAVHAMTAPRWEIAFLWPSVAAAGALLLFAGGVVAIVRGAAWAGMSARYERDPGKAAQRETSQVTGDRELWDALDRGDDPTDAR
ncbi:Trp biosynthesis-associated membrane protein [Nonomuraea maritima]|uniref:Trp biosynthesis-associated membrane protein n=1 Tax=Nonomuraea maritima TaxID=683260 RepID=UPI00372222FD